VWIDSIDDIQGKRRELAQLPLHEVHRHIVNQWDLDQTDKTTENSIDVVVDQAELKAGEWGKICGEINRTGPQLVWIMLVPKKRASPPNNKEDNSLNQTHVVTLAEVAPPHINNNK